MIEEIENYINGEDYPDEIPKRIMGLFEREHADLLAEVKRLREAITSIVNTLGTDVDDANLVAACLGALKGMIE